jgi:hypothetical protein
MLVGGQRIAVHWHGDVVDGEHQVVLRRYMAWPLNPVDKPQQCYKMLRAGLIDRCVQA